MFSHMHGYEEENATCCMHCRFEGHLLGIDHTIICQCKISYSLWVSMKMSTHSCVYQKRMHFSVDGKLSVGT